METVKERVCFYYSYFVSQLFFCAFIQFVFNRVQLVHRPLPKFCATAISVFRGLRFGIDFGYAHGVEVTAQLAGRAGSVVNIWQKPRPDEDSRDRKSMEFAGILAEHISALVRP